MSIHSRPSQKYYIPEESYMSGCGCPQQKMMGCPYCHRPYTHCACRRNERSRFCFMMIMLLVIFFAILYLNPVKTN